MKAEAPKAIEKEVKTESTSSETEDEETLKTKYQKLSGPTIAGEKIDLIPI